MEQVPLQKLQGYSYEQLSQMKEALEQEVEGHMSGHMQLRTALSRYTVSKETVMRFSEQAPEHEMLVPLTNSLYVPGRIDNVESLLVDVGTGYFIEKSNAQTQEFLARRVKLVTNKLDDLEKTIAYKREYIENVMRMISIKSRIMQQQQAQKA
ncbi:Prefoldin subunit-domain-containing protein [Pavlovales sp. CCMP2436]|nr:Prefoldin subunit-domain-containing protein [Pavlovales sp. CCMP2436]